MRDVLVRGGIVQAPVDGGISGIRETVGARDGLVSLDLTKGDGRPGVRMAYRPEVLDDPHEEPVDCAIA